MRYRFTKDEIGIRRNHEGSWVLSVFLDGQYIDHAYMFYSKKEAVDRFQYEFGTYPNDYKPVGVLPLSNFGGIAVMEFEDGIDTYAYVTDNYGDGYKNITKNKIYLKTQRSGIFIICCFYLVLFCWWTCLF